MSSLHHPLFSLVRGDIEEILIHGELAVSCGENTTYLVGINGTYPARSLLKPFQFLSTGLPADEWVGKAQYAAVVGSVSATAEQVDQLKAWYSDSGLRSFLKVPTMFPMDDIHRAILRSEKKAAEQVFHTCFSKHLSILSACQRNGWPAESYLDVEHPFFEKLSGYLRSLIPNAKKLATVTDGCGLPSPVLHISELAELYRRLVSSAGRREKDVVGLMMAYPQWVGGPGRLDTKVMELNAGKLIAKEGADGLWAIGLLPNEQFKHGLGIVLKLSSGYQPALARLALKKLGDSIGIVIPGEIPAGQTLVYHYDVDLFPALCISR